MRKRGVRPTLSQREKLNRRSRAVEAVLEMQFSWKLRTKSLEHSLLTLAALRGAPEVTQVGVTSKLIFGLDVPREISTLLAL